MLGVNTVVNPEWCTRPSGHSVWPVQSLVAGPSLASAGLPAARPATSAGVDGGEAAGWVEPGSAVLRT